MSEPKLISPMLDEFDMGGPISDHDGVQCCPAMRKSSDEKYIVKIISVPASQSKLDALLLTGAYPDKQSALAYFKELAHGIVAEKKILDTLAQLEGFVSYDDCQIVPMDNATGYDVYLLGAYRMTLERENAHKPMTQLAAVNLALDLCAALSVCRRSGYMYVDLKPSNIFVVGDKEYRIGDLGFVRLNSLKYASLPDKYRSHYTAPEVEDAFATLNTTMDIYAVGLILYQVFNDGALPFSGNAAPAEKFPAPAYADQEMAEIILKACDPDPAARWQDPVDMGQAIVNYMQKNGVNDALLCAPTPVVDDVIPEAEEAWDTELTEDTDIPIDPVETLSESEPVVEESVIENTVEDDETEQDAPDDEPVEDEIQTVEVAQPETVDEHTSSEEGSDVEAIEVATVDEADSEDAADEVDSDDTSDDVTNDDYENLSFLDDIDDVDLELDGDYEGVTDEISEFLEQIDELAAHEVPTPVIAPDPVELKIPDTVDSESPADELPIEDSSIADEDTSEGKIDELQDNEESTTVEKETLEEELPYIPKKKRTGLIWTIVIILLLALGVGGYFFYTEYYLQPIHTLDVIGSEDKLQVQLTADIDESLLTVICADSHGNKISAPVVGGMAVFSGLTSDTAYTVSIEVEGFHQLTGATSKVYSTPIQTKIAAMNAITGSESGSVILSFAVEGPDSDQWNVIYNAEGEAERVTTFPAHMVTLAGLTVGKEYTFRLEPVDEIYLSGETSITYVVRNLICAENLHVTSCADGILTVQWDTPEGETVTEWAVRCSNADGFDETIYTAENTVSFENIDDSVAYTLEVTAAEMSVNQCIQISENSVTVSDFQVDSSGADHLVISWKTNREIPAEGWTVRYTVNGVNAPSAIIAKENTVQIPVVPNGNYIFTILDPAGNAALGGPFMHAQGAASGFDGYSVTKSDITPRLCKTPAAASWSYKDLKDEDYVNSFSAGQKISMVLALAKAPLKSDDVVSVTFAIYDESDNLVTFSHASQSWQTLWYQNYCELDVPNVPSEIGTYNLILFFNGTEVGSQKFAITA